jgi:hypothetical protein
MSVNKNLPIEYASTTNKEHPLPRKPRGLNIAIVDLGNSPWIVVRLYVDRVAAAITAAKPGTYAE